MFTLEPEILTILVILALTFAALTFFLVFGVIVYLCFIYHRSTSPIYPFDDTPIPIRERSGTILTPSPIPPVTPQPTKPTQHIRRPPRGRQRLITPSERESTIELVGHQRQDPPYRSESAIIRPQLDGNLFDRQTPYPADIIAREKRMMDHIQFPHPKRF